jgi:hypothetical protein
MVPRSCQFVVAAAAWIAPRAKRADWKREWLAELWHRAESGAPVEDLLRCAWGSFRDAAWLRANERARNLEDSFFHKPLRLELTLFLLAGLFCAISGAFNPSRLPYPNMPRLARFQRGIPFLGALEPIVDAKLISLVKRERILQDVATYRFAGGVPPVARVGWNFFDAAGAKPVLGRGFREDDPEDAALLGQAYWRTRFHSDPSVIGRKADIAGRAYTIVGVVPDASWLSVPRTCVFTPISPLMKFSGAIALLRPGSTIASAQRDIRRVARQHELRWMADAVELVPLWEDPRKRDLEFIFGVALAGVVFGLAFSLARRMGGMLYHSLLAARLFLVLAALGGYRAAVLHLLPGIRDPLWLFHFWVFLLLCCATGCLVARDHDRRCLVCFRRMRMPAPIGLWSSCIFDQPTTEYMCPLGHGALCVAETENAEDYWIDLDESWRELFAHSEA